jgi:hypothetical protein
LRFGSSERAVRAIKDVQKVEETLQSLEMKDAEVGQTTENDTNPSPKNKVWGSKLMSLKQNIHEKDFSHVVTGKRQMLNNINLSPLD